jgi:uncharacterized protein (TIGR01777 family)
MAKKILITGHNGLISNELERILSEKGFEIGYLSRKENRSKNIFRWDYKTGFLDSEAIKWADVIINLAGESVVKKRWTKSVKNEIYNSRIETVKLIKKALAEVPNKVQYLISASAVGYYDQTSDELMTESSPKGNDFLSSVVANWEKEVFSIPSIKTATLRIGVVLSKDGGALPQFQKPISMGFGAHLGSGKQNIAWIHIKDLAKMFAYSIENQLAGAFNAVSQNTRHDAFNNQIAKSLNKKIWMPNVPEFALKLMLGEMSNMITKGSKISNQKIIDQGFNFDCTDLDKTLS